MKSPKPRKATDKWVDQHAANRLSHVATYLLNLKNTQNPQDRAQVAEHVRLLADALEQQNPEEARKKLKAYRT